MSTINERMREVRRALNLKQRELAERLGLPISSVGGWECGANPVPKMRIYQICKEFRVRREWIETGEGDMFEPPENIPTDSERKSKDALRDAAAAMFSELSPNGQSAVLQALRNYLLSHGIDPGPGAWPFK